MADPTPPPSAKDRQLASELVKKAIARSRAGDHETAIEIYLQANTLAPNPLLLSNIASEYQQNNMPDEALNYFCMYLDKDPSGTNAPYAISQVKLIKRQLGKKFDASDVCATPRDDDRPRKTKSKEPREPEDRPPIKDPPPDKPPGVTPRIETAQRDSGNPTLMYTGVAAGIAGLAATGAGVYYGLQAKSISDQISAQDPANPWPPGIRDMQNRGQRYENMQIGFLVAGGVLVTAGVVLYIISRPDGSGERSDRTVVRVAPTTNGVAVFGQF
ncbi:MAG: tetratricopeptide repeat protein [Deltaproteobacteria bacterium]|nr:MAG: tetratricopeptide repeat protein [Deltaproteobacteria bacterium]